MYIMFFYMRNANKNATQPPRQTPQVHVYLVWRFWTFGSSLIHSLKQQCVQHVVLCGCASKCPNEFNSEQCKQIQSWKIDFLNKYLFYYSFLFHIASSHPYVGWTLEKSNYYFHKIEPHTIRTLDTHTHAHTQRIDGDDLFICVI